MKTIELFEARPYAAPSLRVCESDMRRRVFALSTGNLNQDYFGEAGSAGADAEEDDGHSLF